MSPQPSHRLFARACVGVCMAYALLFQAFFLGLTGSAQALNQHSLCITDQAGLTDRADPLSPVPPHDCSCPALCYAAFAPPAPQQLSTSRSVHTASFAALKQADHHSRLHVIASARGPPFAA